MILARSFCLALALMFLTPPAMATTKVMITIDTESYEQGGGNPDRQIWGKQADGEHGIRRIMSMLDRHGFKGVFYLNVYESARHGEAELAEVARTIHSAGHDLQLHTHPISMYGVRHMQDTDLEHQTAILRRGKELLQSWSGATVIAHRAGAFAANLDTLKAEQAAGLAIDASFSPASGQTGLSRQRPATNLPQVLNGVVELPVTFYTQFSMGDWKSQRFLDVESTSLAEMTSVIRQFRSVNFPIVNIMMHSFSFVRYGKADPEVEQRFEQLLDFLAREPGIEVVTVSQLYPGWAARVPVLEKGADFVPYTGFWLTYRRTLEHAREGGLNLAVAVTPPSLAVLASWLYFLRRRKRRPMAATPPDKCKAAER